MRKIIAAILSAAILAFIIGCNNSAEYTPEDAVKHHHLALVCEDDDIYVYGGAEYWKEFAEDAANGKNATLQVHYFEGDDCTVSQINYSNGMYYYYEESEDEKQLSTSFVEFKEYKYLRELKGTAPGSGMNSTFFVLTDSLELTWDDVFHSLIAADLTTVTDIDYEMLWFVIFAEEKLEEPSKLPVYETEWIESAS